MALLSLMFYSEVASCCCQ